MQTTDGEILAHIFKILVTLNDLRSLMMSSDTDYSEEVEQLDGAVTRIGQALHHAQEDTQHATH